MSDRGAESAVADRLRKTVMALSTQQLRVAYLRSELLGMQHGQALRVLELLCEQAQGPSAQAREVLVALVGVLHDPGAQPLVERLRDELDEDQTPCLGRVLQVDDGTGRLDAAGEDDLQRKVPDYGRGRPLTLGERRALARRPSRSAFDKLLLDPHPMVIRNLLANSMTTEDDVVRLAARRPLPAQVMLEIVRHPRWNVRRRVRMALVLNPYCPTEIGLPLVALLIRSELRMIVDGPETNPMLRAAARDRLQTMPGQGGSVAPPGRSAPSRPPKSGAGSSNAGSSGMLN